MAKSSLQKLKTVALLKILETKSDSENGLSMDEILCALEERGIPAERKSIYRDIEALREIGYDIQKLPTRPVTYGMARAQLGFDDIMMLIDAVQSSRFLTERKAAELAKSLKSLVSDRQQKQLEKRVHVRGRIRNQSESVFHNVDIIHEALQSKRKVQFLYYRYDTNLERRPRHEGRLYEVTPVKVIFADGNYYLAAFDDEAQCVKTFRIDRMELLQISDAKATRNAVISNYDFEDFAHERFGMFHGEGAMVTLRVSAPLVDAVVDRFGLGLDIVKKAEDYVDVRVSVQVSPQFYGWVAGLDGGVTLRSPKKVVDAYSKWLKARAKDF